MMHNEWCYFMVVFWPRRPAAEWSCQGSVTSCSLTRFVRPMSVVGRDRRAVSVADDSRQSVLQWKVCLLNVDPCSLQLSSGQSFITDLHVGTVLNAWACHYHRRAEDYSDVTVIASSGCSGFTFLWKSSSRLRLMRRTCYLQKVASFKPAHVNCQC
jgi:hypothetical protein